MSSLANLTPAHSITVDGVQINYQANLSHREYPTLVLIHGFGASLETWSDIWPLLGVNYSVVRVDLKGSGFSGKPKDQRYAPADQAHLMTKFLRELSLTNVVLVGHSLGGGIALLTCFECLGATDGLEIKGLVLIDSAGYPQELPFFVKTLRNPLTRCLSNFAPKNYRARYVLTRIFKVKERVTPDRIHRYAFFLDLPGSRHALYQTAKHIVPEDVAEFTSQFPRIAVPTLAIWGEVDPVIPLESGRRFGRDIPNARLLILPETGHVPQEERPSEVYGAIDEFMKSLK